MTTPTARLALLSALLGNVLEWYDFALYATASSLVFNQIFFPSQRNPLLGQIEVFVVFFLGFLARPVGGILFGHIGDRFGRFTAMMWTFAIMGVATAAIGFLPGYSRIGLLAPLLLMTLRVVQGVAVGGEWAGGVLMLGAHARPGNLGRTTALSQSGVAIGMVMGNATLLLAQYLDPDALTGYGWRVPFVLTIPFIVLGLGLRHRLRDNAPPRQDAATRLPILEVLRHAPRAVLCGIGLRLAENGGIYILTTFSLVYGRSIHVPVGWLLLGVSLGLIADAIAMPLFGYLSDRIGQRQVYLVGIMAFIPVSWLFFELIASRAEAKVLLAFVLAFPLAHAPMIAVQPALLSGLFPAPIRYTGVALAHELGAIVAGGLSPMLATALYAHYHSVWSVFIYMTFLSLLTLVTMIFMKPAPQA
ncbi:MFS transporter [Komagataeibacter xylinus]|uniref:MHS family MFS transporter n=1 Tax=Komagataeibacter xylinus TaxID=28448 RepID=A0A857FS76_KOMXY|nr:MFS transporter [Komagataeibacter xylinus]QHC36000.1 MHS family MFS transporter [Komagataeibacter xylinus]